MSTHPTAGSQASNQYGTFAVHYATEKQVEFIASLLSGRDRTLLGAAELAEVDEIAGQVITGKVNKKAASRAIDLLIDLPKVEAAPSRSGHPASDKQVAFARKLLAEKDLTGTGYDTPAWAGMEVDGRVRYAVDFMSKASASATITELLALPRKAAGSTKPGSAPVEGMHFIDGVVIKVQRAVHGSGNLYAKQLVIDVRAELEDGDAGAVIVPAQAHFEYAPGVVNRTSTETLMAKEDGAKFGRLYGMCIKCAATLTDEASIERGMGPICAGKGWA